MVANNIYPTLDEKSSKNSEEKTVGFTAPIDISVIDAPATLNPAHAEEYVEFLQLKDHFEADPKAHKALIRRLDLRIIPMLFLYYLLNSLDKANAGNVKIYTFLKDTNMSSHQFNLALTWYFFTYAGLEAPSNATMLSGAFGGLLAYAVGPLQGRLGLKQWQYLFIIEGAITIFFGILGLWLCVNFPETWSSRFFKPDEMKFLQLRVKYENGAVAPDDTFRWSAFWEAVKDWKTYFIASLLAFGGSVPTYSVNYTLATMVQSLGYTSVKAQAMTAPPYVFAFFSVIAIAIYSDKYRCRARSLLISYFVGTTGIVILWPCLYHKNLAGVSYFTLFLVVAGYNMQAPAVGSWLGTNVRNPAKRSAAMGWQSTFGQLLGGCIGANIFVSSEAPTYKSGFIVLLVLVMVGGVGATIANWYCLRASNLKKDKIPLEELEGKYTEQQLSEMGEYSPYFRYIL
ncbi:hypothetical protein G7Y89_g4509 [Cudoniella acicularis]|uniref:High-affinity nicotinic acid transporter n=1 Tax=Cudoniella acicularis TaxID=354080 RepID=A0A8H4RQ48_9HELO|nr:hypothetical protein G7Y89_g4509 [Cudoniella acicularis]